MAMMFRSIGGWEVYHANGERDWIRDPVHPDAGSEEAEGTPSPDPFGDRIAEALRQEDAIVPHPVQRITTEAEKDALWDSVIDYGKGG